ncbi:AraC family transcriptional regulator [Desulfosporosinus sp. SB140]|uniref:AraC family transcriptional regulator n=1 Tax=Desulfosporosinus paludis TaxID=3115649 RepID=UPI00388EAD7C
MQIIDIPISKDLQETTIHGDYAFPLAIYEDHLHSNLIGYVDLHWHDELQFSYVTKGAVEFVVNQKNYCISENQGIFINSGCLHMAKAIVDPDSTYICINVNAKLLSSFQGSIIDTAYVTPFIESECLPVILFEGTVPWQKDILSGLHRINFLYEKGEFAYELNILLEFTQVWLNIVTNMKDILQGTNKPSETNQNRLKTFLSFIQRNYRNKISLEDIASSANVSRGECCRLFRNTIQISPIEYLISYRINKSLYLLENSSMTVSQISDYVGFGSVSYFIERFRKQIGAPPKEFQRNLRNFK